MIRSVRVGTLSMAINDEFRKGLDSHADTCVVDDDTALLVHDFERPVNVHGYNERLERLDARPLQLLWRMIIPETDTARVLAM
jgi:hypothetical protein